LIISILDYSPTFSINPIETNKLVYHPIDKVKRGLVPFTLLGFGYCRCAYGGDSTLICGPGRSENPVLGWLLRQETD